MFVRIAAQCPIGNFQVTPDPSSPSSQLSVSWECDKDNNDFQVTLQLTNRDQCDARDDRVQPPFDVHTLGFSDWNNVEVDLGNGFYGYSTILTDLLPYSTYAVTIQSRRPRGVGDIQSADVTTGEAVPSVRPVVYQYATTTTNIDYYWIEIKCGTRHGNITGNEYRLTYTIGGQPVSEAVLTPMTFINGPGVRITGLRCGMQYTFNVAWKNNAGTGRRGAIITTTSNVSPGSVQNMQASLTATQITITWMEPAERGCPVVDTYEVTCEGNTRHEDECQDVFPIDAVMDTTSSLSYVCDVKQFYSYNITLKTTGGPVMELSEAQLTPGSAPSAPPGNVRETGRSATTRTITWDDIPCSDRNGQILGYRYELTLQSTVIDSNDVRTTSVTVTLDTADMYIFSVTGRTDSGIGPYTHININMPRMSSKTTVEPKTERTTASNDTTDKTDKQGDTGSIIIVAAASGVIVVVLILIIVIVVFVVIRKR
ncbi:receptor-type tyrosine-protein phosphatase F-like [Amphiura filiformis]|uniref:receptor-type tyrosine-protein phosphatase F-like n=1 Tax=Amphiura filiformis TaxID=82378 RepID=UPI003B228DAE